MNIESFESISEGRKQQFKVHYHLRNGSHEMDALVRNRCEAEILGLLREVSRILDVEFKVDVVPPEPGGWEEHILLIGQYQEQITFLRDIVGSIFTMGATALGGALFVRHKLKHAKQQTTLNDLAIEKARLEVKKLAREDDSAEGKPNGELPIELPLTAEEIAAALLGRKKVQLKRSNLYRNLASYTQVEAVGFGNSHQKGASERIVERQHFERFIVGPEELEPLVYRNVEIEVVSPVLRAGNHNWRGIFEKKSVSFELGDGEFHRQVLDQEVVFQNGTRLICDLEVHQRENEVGEPEVTKRIVVKVHKVRQEPKGDPSPQGRLDLPEPTDWSNTPGSGQS